MPVADRECSRRKSTRIAQAGWPTHYPWIDAQGLNYSGAAFRWRADVGEWAAGHVDHFTTRPAQHRVLDILQFKLDIPREHA